MLRFNCFGAGGASEVILMVGKWGTSIRQCEEDHKEN